MRKISIAAFTSSMLVASMAMAAPVQEQEVAPCGWDSFTTSIGARSASGNATLNDRGYLGLYQFGKPVLAELGYVRAAIGTANSNLTWTGKAGIKSTDAFLAKSSVQTAAYREYAKRVWSTVSRIGLDKWIGRTLPDGGKVTQSGLLMACQLGCGRVLDYFDGGMTCTAETSDANGLCVQELLTAGEGYDVSPVTGKSDVQSISGQCGPTAVTARAVAQRFAQAAGTATSTDTTTPTTEPPISMSTRICSVVMPIIQGIDCSKFDAPTMAFCNTWKPYLMTSDQCDKAEAWAQQQVQASPSANATTPAPPPVTQPPDPQPTQAGASSSGPPPGPGQVDNGDDSERGSTDTTMITPQPSQSLGGGPGGTPNQAVPGTSYSGGPIPVGNIQAGNWAQACMKQTSYDGNASWSYVLACSQMQTDPPRRQSSSAGSNVGIPGIGGSGGTTGVPSPGGSGGTGTGGSGAGAYSGERPPSDGTKNTNYTEPRQDPQCFQRLQAAGATATFTGFNQAQANAGGRRCFVATAVTVSKWSSTTMGGPVSNMNCPLAEKVDKWLKGIGATNMTHYGSYGCRAMRGGPSSTGLSMHGYGDAFDVASMNGQKFSNWNSAPSMQQTAWQAACGIFDRVLGPGYYAGKFVHFHVEQGHGGSCNR